MDPEVRIHKRRVAASRRISEPKAATGRRSRAAGLCCICLELPETKEKR
jgi:hypothetical protein